MASNYASQFKPRYNLFWTLNRASLGEMLQGHNTQGGDQIKVESEEIKRDFRNRMQH
jgi:hypothetical protein